MTTLDLTLLPLYRLKNQELPALPGLLAMTPPRKAARGREHDRLIVYLVLMGNATLSTAEYLQLTSRTANRFFEKTGALTTAMRASVEALNSALLDRNMASTGQGQYAIGTLVLAVLRGAQCTLLKSGPAHVYRLGSEAMQHIHDPALSGKGLGTSQSAAFHFSQFDLAPGDRLIFSGKPPDEWERLYSEEKHPSSIEATRRRLLSMTRGDVNAVLIQAQEGGGGLTLLRPVPSGGKSSKEVASSAAPPAPLPETESLPPSIQPDTASKPSPVDNLEKEFPEEHESEFSPSAYAIPPQPEDDELPEIETVAPQFPASIPRAAPPEPEAPPLREMDEPIMDESEETDEPEEPRQPSEATRQVARGLVGGMRASRRLGAALSRNLQKFLPNLLPDGNSSTASSTIIMTFIAIVVPLLVVVAGVTVYLKFGRSYQYDNLYLQAEAARDQAQSATDPARQRDRWQAVLFYLDQADYYRQTPESDALRNEAQSKLDTLQGIQRLNFYPAFASGVNAQISRLAANETDLYMLDAERGRVLHASQVGRNFEMDEAFRCESGQYGDYQVGPIVDILILPRLNSLDAAVLGIDAGGNLLYCSPGEVGQAIPLPVPDSNWGRVTGFTYDSGSLYVLDAPSRAIWVYPGKDASFIDRPYFFFGGQIPEIEDAIDMAVNGDDLFLLHADGHLSTCSYSRLEAVPTRCQDPAPLTNLLPAYQDIDLFAQAHITQMQITLPPDANLLLLDADNRSVLRVSSRTLELQNQIYPMPGTSLKPGPAGAMTVNPNRVLFLSVDDQVYFAADMP
ncbi:MAG: hypothetical protein AB8I58_20905 [Anaerolineales bacterium]